MKKLAIYVAVLIPGMFVPHLNAQACSSYSLTGQYSFEASGTFGGSPFAAAGQTIYHGDGTADGVIQASVNGTVYPAVGWTAQYSLTPMTAGLAPGEYVCVLNKTITVPAYGLTISFFGTAGDGVKALRFIVTAACSATGTAAASCDSNNKYWVPATISGTARQQ